MRAIVIYAVCLWLPVLNNISLPQHPSLRDDYQRGLQLKKEGQWQEALKIWWTARNQLGLRGESDPRIGIAFIKLATEKAAKNYYGTASDLYLWGFSSRIPAECQSAVREEAKRIIPLLETEEAKRWRELVSQDSPTLSHEIRLFWLMKDSRPSTRANERLIEHWQRIAYARKHFTKNHNSVYECDDRGTIYAKYGTPLRKKFGNFGASGASNLELMRWVPNSLARMAIRLWDPAPEYEVWLYDGLGTEDPLIFLFAQRDGTGSFGLRNGVEWTIGARSKELPPRPALLRYYLQITYYAELRMFADYYEERYYEIEREWQYAVDRGVAPRRIRLESSFSHNKIVDMANPPRRYAVADKSDYEHKIPSINLVTSHVRLLDPRNKPRLAVFTISSPKFSADDIAISADSFEIPAYRLEHTLIFWDVSLRELDRVTDRIPEGAENLSGFQVEHTSRQAYYSISAEASPVLSDTLLAMGKLFSQIEPPLNADPDSLEVSDLVLGVEFPQETSARNPRPIPLLPADEFTKTDPMQVYLEVYHLDTDRGGYGRFTIEFSAHKLDKKGRWRKKEGEISLTFDFDSVGSTSKEYSSISLSKLKPGTYELIAKVRDAVTAQEKTRRGRFSVVK